MMTKHMYVQQTNTLPDKKVVRGTFVWAQQPTYQLILLLQMAEGGVETISETLDSISLSSTSDEHDALGKALNISDQHGMLPDDMVRKEKRRKEQKEKKKKKTASDKIVRKENVNKRTPETRIRE